MSLALEQSCGPLSGMVGGEKNEICQAVLLGVAELNPGINNGFHPGKVCAHPGQPHTGRRTSPVSVATGMVPAVSWSATTSHLHMPCDAQLKEISGNVECTVASSGHQHGSWKRGLGFSDGLFTQQIFPAVLLPRKVCYAVGNLVAVGQRELL